MMGPVPWFLATAPSPNAEMLPRPVLWARLDDAVAAHRITVVSAPSGFGKTVAVSQWAAVKQRTSPGSVSWLTLTHLAGDPGAFLAGVVTALQKLASDRGDSTLHRALAAVFDATSYTAAIEVLLAIDAAHPVAVVIDDFQKARDVVAEPHFASFIERCPRWIQLVLVTADAAGPALSRLRFHAGLSLIGPSELALQAGEISDLAALTGRPVTTERAEAIHAATGGWPAAVRLGLLAQETPNLATDDDLTEYIHVHVLGRMRSELADFILRTTVPSRLDEPVACALSGRSDAARLLGECVSAGLFLECFDSADSTVYQWHSLFSAHCRTILRRTDPDSWQRLNVLAARELAQRFPLAAVAHAVDAGDADLANAILTDHWLELLLQSRSDALDRACVAVIRQFGETPDLLLIRACCRDLAGDTIDSGLLAARARAAERDAIRSPRTAFIADLTQVLLSDEHDSMVAAADRAQAALADRAVVTPTGYACALFILGWANSRLRRGEAGYALLEAAVHESGAMGLTELAERSTVNLGFAMAAAGEFDRAIRVLGARTEQHSPELWLAHDGGGIELFTLGYIAFWRGELAEARRTFLELDTAVGAGYPDMGRMMLAHTVAVLRDHTAVDIAQAALARLPTVDSHGVPWTSYRIAAQARLADLRGARSQALELAAQLVGHGHLPAMSAIVSGMCRRLGAPGLARRLAEAARDDPSQPYSQASGLLTIALLDWEHGDTAAAHTHLEECLTLAAPARVRYPFIDAAGPQCAELLAAHAPRTAHPHFLDECLVVGERAPATEVPHADMLTPRERQVLAYLRKQMTANEIAAQMAVSVNTVKTHQRAIYRKLGVANRREAVRLTRD